MDAAKYAPIMCAGTAVFNAIRKAGAGVGPGETVAVQGLGGLGHLAVQYAARLGYRVVAISRGTEKEAFARQLGAHEYVDASAGDAGEQLQRLGGARLILATAPTAGVMNPLLKGLGILGKLIILSVPGEVTIDTAVMVSVLVSSLDRESATVALLMSCALFSFSSHTVHRSNCGHVAMPPTLRRQYTLQSYRTSIAWSRSSRWTRPMTHTVSIFLFFSSFAARDSIRRFTLLSFSS